MRQFHRLQQKQGLAFKLSSKVTAIDASGKVLEVKVEPAAGSGAAEMIEADIVLVAIGRVPYTEGLGLEAVGVNRDNRGRVVVDAHLRTNVGGIYAIGDAIAGRFDDDDVSIRAARDLHQASRDVLRAGDSTPHALAASSATDRLHPALQGAATLHAPR